MKSKIKISFMIGIMIIIVCLIWSGKEIVAETVQYKLQLVTEFPLGKGPDAIDLQVRGAPFGAPTKRYFNVRGKVAVFDNSESFYLINAPLGKLAKFDSKGGKIRDIFSPDGEISFPFQLTLDRWDNLYVLFHDNGVPAKREFGLAKFDSAGNLLFWLKGKKLGESYFYSRPRWSVGINGIIFIREEDGKTYRRFNKEGNFIGVADYNVVDAEGYIYSIPKHNKIDELPIKRYLGDKVGSKYIKDLEFLDQRQLAPFDVSSYISFRKFDEQGNMYFAEWANNYEELSSTYYPKLAHSVTDYVDTGGSNVFRYNYEKDEWFVLEREALTPKEHKYCASTGVYISTKGRVYETFLFFDDPLQLTSKDRLRIYRWEAVK